MKNKYRFVPSICCLEDRVMLNSYFWRPNPNLLPADRILASQGSNWTNENGDPYVAQPGQNDRLFLDAQSTGVCLFNSAANRRFISIDTTGFPVQFELFIETGIWFYGGAQNNVPSVLTGSIESRNLLNPPNPTIDSGSIMFRGPVTLDTCTFRNVIVGNGGLDPLGGFLNPLITNPMTIRGNNRFVDLNANPAGIGLFNSGTLNWVSGNISLVKTIINNGSQFNITSSGTISIEAGQGENPICKFDNVGPTGTVTKSGAGVTSTISVQFNNTGTLRVNSGNLAFTGHPKQTGTGSTILNGGSMSCVIYWVVGGTLSGVGTITGRIHMSEWNGTGLPNAIHPGVGTSPGRLDIVGSLQMSPRTEITIDTGTDPTMDIGQLNIIKNAAALSGSIHFNGNVVINRNAQFRPAVDAVYSFLTYSTSTGTFRPVLRPANDQWTDPNNQAQNNLRFIVYRGSGNLGNIPWVHLDVRVMQPGRNPPANFPAGEPVLLSPFQNDPDFAAAPWVCAVEGDVDNVGQTIQTAGNGSFRADSNGVIDYIPPISVGEDSVEYTITDGIIEKTAVITFFIVDTSPTAYDTEFTLKHDIALNIELTGFSKGLLDNAINFDTDNIEITKVNSQPSLVNLRFQTTAGGWLTVNDNGAFLYEPTPGSIYDDEFSVTVDDGTNEDTFTVVIHVINNAPVAENREFGVLAGQVFNVTPFQFPYGLLDFATDGDGDTLVIGKVNGEAENVGDEVPTTEGGSVLVHEDGSFEYTPPNDFEDDDDTFTVGIFDGVATTTITVTIHVASTTPSAANGEFDADEDTELNVPANEGLLCLAEDPEEDGLSIVAIGGQGYTPGNTTFTDHGGQLVVEADGSFSYTPPTDWHGDDTFSYTVSDGLTTATATITITVAAVNDAPVNRMPLGHNTEVNTAFVFSTAIGHAIAIDDVDAGSEIIQVTLTATDGIMTLSGTTGLNFSFLDGNGEGIGDGTEDATMTFRGTVAAINAALEGLGFMPTADFTGDASLEVISNDLGNTGAGGALSDTDSIWIPVGVVPGEDEENAATLLLDVVYHFNRPAGEDFFFFDADEEKEYVLRVTWDTDFITYVFSNEDELNYVFQHLEDDREYDIVIRIVQDGQGIDTGSGTG